MEHSVESNSFEKFKVKRYHHCPYFAHISDFFFFEQKRFLTKSSKPKHENLVLITSTVQVKLSKINFNFDDARTNFFKFSSLRFLKIMVSMIMLYRTRTEQQSRTNIYLQLKFPTVLSCNHWQHW